MGLPSGQHTAGGWGRVSLQGETLPGAAACCVGTAQGEGRNFGRSGARRRGGSAPWGASVTRIGFVKRAILRGRRPPAITAAWILVALALPTLLRLAMNPLLDGRLPYLTYFPAVLLATVFLGWRAGTIVLLASALIANVAAGVVGHAGWSEGELLLGALFFIAASSMMILLAQTLRRTVVELDATAERERFLAAELGHRAKNHLALIEALARQCRKDGDTSDLFFERLTPRLQALGRAQDLLTRSGWGPCSLAWLVEEALLPFASHGGISFEGPEVTIPPAYCTPMIIAVHELGTNAAKYGALSVPQGKVTIRWCDPGDGTGTRIEWRESDGPPVEAPQRRGLGTRLLARLPAFAEVKQEFPAEGATCLIRLNPALLKEAN